MPTATSLRLRPAGLRGRDVLSTDEAGRLASLFKILANDTRLRVLHVLVRAGELCVTDLAAELGMKPQAVSNQLRDLVLARILATRRDGVNVLYRIVDPCVPTLLDYGLCLAECSRGKTS